jgi:Integrase core domain
VRPRLALTANAQRRKTLGASCAAGPPNTGTCSTLGGISAWRTEYNEQRPHSSLGYKTSNDFAQEHEAKDFYVAGVGQEDSNAVPLPHTPIPARSEGGVNINSRIRECAE